MYLQEEELRKLSKEPDIKLINDFIQENFRNLAYDLRIKEIQWIEERKPHISDEHILQPGDSVFVSTIEDIKLPNDMIAQVIPRNSSVRMGLDISAPVYQPGHHTRVFVRVTNIADNEITLKQEMSIFSIMFYRLDKDVSNPYAGAFSDQFDFTGVKAIHSVQTAIATATKSEKDKIDSAVRNIYATVLTLMSIFITVFSVIIMNGKFLPEIKNGYGVIFFNATLIGTMAALIAMVSVLLNRIPKKAIIALIITVLICGIISYFCLPCV